MTVRQPVHTFAGCDPWRWLLESGRRRPGAPSGDVPDRHPEDGRPVRVWRRLAGHASRATLLRGHGPWQATLHTAWATVPGGGGPYKDIEFVRNGVKVQTKGFKEDAIGDFALDFLRQQSGEAPFYLHVPFYAPHTPFTYQPEEDRAHYQKSSFGCFPDTPKHPNQNPGLGQNHGKNASKMSYSALISGADRNIGRVLRQIGRAHV